MQPYLALLDQILTHGTPRQDRTGTGTLSIFGHQMRFDLAQGFPAVTTKKLFFRGVVHELLWFLAGDTNVKTLQAHRVKIWDEWADEDGALGPVYGAQWRAWEGPGGGRFDQIEALVHGLKTDPFSRRHVVSAWAVHDLEKMALVPCHCLFQCYVREQGGQRFLDCQLYQRSADVFLGVPFNIASYALLTHLLAQVVGLVPGHFVHTFGDAHLYRNHTAQAKVQLEREPLPLPTLWLDPSVTSLNEFTHKHIKLLGYQSHPKLPAPISV